MSADFRDRQRQGRHFAPEESSQDSDVARKPRRGTIHDNDYSVRPSTDRLASKYERHQIQRLDPATKSKESTRQQAKRQLDNDYFDLQRRKRTKLRVAVVAVVVAASVFLALIAAAFVFVSSSNSSLQDGLEPQVLSDVEEFAAELEDSPQSVSYSLLVGLDTDRSGAYVANDIAVLCVDDDRNSVDILAVPYNLRVYIEDLGYTSLGNARASGGQELLKDTLEEILGVKFEHYAEADLDQFLDVVDCVGGIQVDVPDNTSYGGVDVASGKQTLDSDQAAVLCRCWQSYADGDEQRMRNCLNVLTALLDELSEIGIFKYPKVLPALSDAVSTDLALDDLSAFKKVYSSSSVSCAILPYSSGTVEGVSYAFFDEEEYLGLMGLLHSEGISAISKQDVENSGSFVAGTWTISIQNGSGVEGVATQAQSRLEDAGFVVSDVGNANQFVYDETLVVYNEEDELNAAENVVSALRCGRAVYNAGSYVFDGDILVVVGNDWVPS